MPILSVRGAESLLVGMRNNAIDKRDTYLDHHSLFPIILNGLNKRLAPTQKQSRFAVK